MATSPTVFAEPDATGGIGPVGKIIELHTGFGFTEGPAADGKGNVYFTDIPNEKTLFVTARKSLDALKMSAKGHVFARAKP